MNTHPFTSMSSMRPSGFKRLVNSCLTVHGLGMELTISARSDRQLGWNDIRLTGPGFVGTPSTRNPRYCRKGAAKRDSGSRDR